MAAYVGRRLNPLPFGFDRGIAPVFGPQQILQVEGVVPKDDGGGGSGETIYLGIPRRRMGMKLGLDIGSGE